MTDLMYIALFAAFTVATVLFVRGCERLMPAGTGRKP